MRFEYLISEMAAVQSAAARDLRVLGEWRCDYHVIIGRILEDMAKCDRVMFQEWCTPSWKPEEEGTFLSWGLESGESGSSSVAIIRKGDGTVVCVIPEKVRFL